MFSNNSTKDELIKGCTFFPFSILRHQSVGSRNAAFFYEYHKRNDGSESCMAAHEIPRMIIDNDDGNE